MSERPDPECQNRWPGATKGCIDERCCLYPDPCQPFAYEAGILAPEPEPADPPTPTPPPIRVLVGEENGGGYVAFAIKGTIVLAEAVGPTKVAAASTLARYMAIQLDQAYAAALARKTDTAPAEPGEPALYYDEQTLHKVSAALDSAGLPHTQIREAINKMLYAGILFRERARKEASDD